MKWDLSKLFFPHLPRDLRRRAMAEFMVVAMTTAVVALLVISAIIWMDRKR